MPGRLMAKTFDVEKGEKGSGLQSKINAFTNGKNIVDVHDFTLVDDSGHVKALLLYQLGDGDAVKTDRLYAKVVEGVDFGSSELQTKFNSFSKGKDLDVKGAATFPGNGTSGAIAVVLYQKIGGGDEEE